MKSQLNHLRAPKENEISLFRKMSQILSNTYHVDFVEEIHKRSVHYTSAAIGANAVRELGDLWIIAYSPNQNRAKMTFLQAKYDRRQLAALTKFSADYFQYELLSTRPQLTYGGTFNFPSDILSFSCCDSVGSYGVFYHDLNNEIELAYCSAVQLSVSSPAPTSYGQHNVDLYFPSAPQGVNGCTCKSCRELNMTKSIDDFTTNLLQLHIDRELELNPQHQQALRLKEQYMPLLQKRFTTEEIKIGATEAKTIKGYIELAISFGINIRFGYHKSVQFDGGEQSLRTIRPTEVRMVGNSLCVGGFCHMRKEERTFAIDRIDKLVLNPAAIEYWSENQSPADT